MKGKDSFLKAREHVFKKSKEGFGKDKVVIKGMDLSEPATIDSLINSYTSTGFQGTNLALAVEAIKKMQEEKATIFFGCNSNMITSGIREPIRWLVENKKIQVFVTTGGGIEEDIIKCLGDFYLGSFNADNSKLREQGINRTGNIFIPNQRYLDFEKFIQPILKTLFERQKKENRATPASELIWALGEAIDDKSSVLYWAARNKIPVFCPSITDGALGDQISFFKYNNPAFAVDVAADIQKLDEISITSRKTGMIVLGSSAAKHHIANANQFRGGADYAVYITTETEEGGSDAGAKVEEAISWGKVKAEAKHVKVYGDATIIFPLVAVAAFKK